MKAFKIKYKWQNIYSKYLVNIIFKIVIQKNTGCFKFFRRVCFAWRVSQRSLASCQPTASSSLKAVTQHLRAATIVERKEKKSLLRPRTHAHIQIHTHLFATVKKFPSQSHRLAFVFLSNYASVLKIILRRQGKNRRNCKCKVFFPVLQHRYRNNDVFSLAFIFFRWGKSSPPPPSRAWPRAGKNRCQG